MRLMKKQEASPKEKRFIQIGLPANLTELAKDEEDEASALFYVLAYIFLLQVRSETLPIFMGGQGWAEEARAPPCRRSCRLSSAMCTILVSRFRTLSMVILALHASTCVTHTHSHTPLTQSAVTVTITRLHTRHQYRKEARKNKRAQGRSSLILC